MFIKTILSWILLLVFTTRTSGIPLNGPCKLKHLNGSCQLLKSCKFAMAILVINDIPTLRSMFCGFEGRTAKVCCPNVENITYDDDISSTRRPTTTSVPFPITEQNPETTATKRSLQPTNVLPSRNVCGLITIDDRILGGEVTKMEEFPWLVRLKYYSPTTTREFFGCAGSLISDRWVLTAAHCIGSSKLISVRLGEWDSETEKDCQDGVCIEAIDIKVDKYVVHPKFDRDDITNADIGLVRLERPVEFTDYIQPVCLPTTKYIAKQDYIDAAYWAAGWGLTELGVQGVVKRKVALNSVPFRMCHISFPNLATATSRTDLICAGGKKGEDTCRGDSGGPLVRQVSEEYETNWFLFGITSFGEKKCGTAGRPGVYTRVSHYMDWILDTISN